MSSTMKNRINETIKCLEKAFDDWNDIAIDTKDEKKPPQKKIVSTRSKQLFRKLKKQINELSG